MVTDKEKREILANLKKMADAYEAITSHSGHIDFAGLNEPGYVSISGMALTANFIDKNGRNYLMSLRRLERR